MENQLQDISHLCTVVLMERDYTTDTFALGRRTYRRGSYYRMPPKQAVELLEREVAAKVNSNRYWPNAVRPEFEPVRVMPKVSRWFTSSGLDTHHLSAGVEATVPSNLAAFLVGVGFADSVVA